MAFGSSYAHSHTNLQAKSMISSTTFSRTPPDTYPVRVLKKPTIKTRTTALVRPGTCCSEVLFRVEIPQVKSTPKHKIQCLPW